MEDKETERVGWLEYWDTVFRTLLDKHNIQLGAQTEVYEDWKCGKTTDESVKSYL